MPAKPTGVTAIDGCSGDSVVVKFGVPEDEWGESYVTHYIAVSDPGGVEGRYDVSAGDVTMLDGGMSITLEGLDEGVEYKVAVRAVNNLGQGQKAVSNVAMATSGEQDHRCL